jgi:hypothetical protein
MLFIALGTFLIGTGNFSEAIGAFMHFFGL